MKLYARRRAIVQIGIGIAALPTLVQASDPAWDFYAMEDFAPFNYYQDNHFLGIDVDILNHAAHRMNVSIRYIPLPWRRAILAFTNGQGDALFQLTPTEDRSRVWRMVGPLRQTVIVVVTRRDATVVPRSIEELRGLRVGVVRGFTYGETFDRASDFTREISPDEQTSLRKLLLGRVDVAIVGRANARFIMQKLGIEHQLTIQPTPLFAEGRYIAFHRTPQGLARGERLQAVLDDMHTDGTISAILARYGEEN